MPDRATCRQNCYLISSDSETITSSLLTDILYIHIIAPNISQLR